MFKNLIFISLKDEVLLLLNIKRCCVLLLIMDKKSIWHFSKKEKIDLIVSWIILSLAFSLVLLRFKLFGDLLGSQMPFETAVPIAFIAVGTGFVFHELAHRQAARHYGFHSEYRAWYPMLGMAVVFAFLTGWILAAPGATYFFGQNVTRKQNGIISFAGPAINIILGFLFLIIGLLSYGSIFGTIIVSVAMINFFFAFFNLLPILMLDGSKVVAWDARVWIVGIAIAGVMSFFPELFISLLGFAF